MNQLNANGDVPISFFETLFLLNKSVNHPDFFTKLIKFYLQLYIHFGELYMHTCLPFIYNIQPYNFPIKTLTFMNI